MKNITGCILIGGRSLRMGGGIKSLKNFNRKTILDRVIERAQKQVKIIAINSNTKDKILSKYNLPIFADVIEGYLGPLAGIHASLIWSKSNNPENEWVITFAGDTPFFPNNMVESMYDIAIKQNKKIIIAHSFKRDHPVFGLWHVSLEKNLFNSIKNEKVRKIDLWAKKFFFATVDFTNDKYDPFFNINTMGDLFKAKDIENNYLHK